MVTGFTLNPVNRCRAPFHSVWGDEQDPSGLRKFSVSCRGLDFLHQYFSSRQNGVLLVLELYIVQWEQRRGR